MASRSLILLPALLLALTGCGTSAEGGENEQAEAATATQQSSSAEPAESAAAPAAEEEPDPFPGYPLLVDLASIDTRVTSSLEGNTAEGKVVALAPGIYTPYNTHFSDLDRYYEDPIIYGDQMMKQEYFPQTGGSSWGGVQPGTREPGFEGVEPAPEINEPDLATQVKEQFPDYPLLVDLASVDTRVASSLEGNTAEGKVVALTPGIYTPYNTHFSDLDRYYEDPIIYGDQMMKQEYFPQTGGSSWGGVQPGTQELQG